MRRVGTDTVHRFHRLDVRVRMRRRAIKVFSGTVFIMLCMVVGTLLYVTSLQNRVQRMTVEIQRLQARSLTCAKELRNRSNEYSEYCSPDHIFRMVQQFRLDLRQPDPGQVYRMPSGRPRHVIGDNRVPGGLSRDALVAQSR